VIANVLGHEPLEMAFIEHNHTVEQISTARPDKTFGQAILPWALDAGSFGFYSKAPDRLNNAVIKLQPRSPERDVDKNVAAIASQIHE
ncbi:MAG: hypothetical protein WBC92_18795, partial [Terracidiphilus sp.]